MKILTFLLALITHGSLFSQNTTRNFLFSEALELDFYFPQNDTIPNIKKEVIKTYEVRKKGKSYVLIPFDEKNYKVHTITYNDTSVTHNDTWSYSGNDHTGAYRISLIITDYKTIKNDSGLTKLFLKYYNNEIVMIDKYFYDEYNQLKYITHNNAIIHDTTYIKFTENHLLATQIRNSDTTFYFYNDKSQLIRTFEKFTKYNNLTIEYNYEYHANGKISKTIEVRSQKIENKRKVKHLSSESYFIFNELGLLSEYGRKRSGITETLYYYDYEYDSFGNWIIRKEYGITKKGYQYTTNVAKREMVYY